MTRPGFDGERINVILAELRSLYRLQRLLRSLRQLVLVESVVGPEALMRGAGLVPGCAEGPLAATKLEDQIATLESALFVLLDPLLNYIGWVKSALGGTFGDRADAAEHITAQARLQLLQSLRGAGLGQGVMEEGFLWKICDNVRNRYLKQLARSSTLALDPTREIPLAGGPVHRIAPTPARTNALLADLLQAGPRGRASLEVRRRQFMVLLHTPFLAHPSQERAGSTISHGELADLLEASQSAISDDKRYLARELGTGLNVEPPHRRIEWFRATGISCRLQLQATAAHDLLHPPSHHAALEVLWVILKLLQIDAAEQRLTLQTRLDGDPDLALRVGAHALRLALDMEPATDVAGATVNVTGVFYNVFDLKTGAEKGVPL